MPNLSFLQVQDIDHEATKSSRRVKVCTGKWLFTSTHDRSTQHVSTVDFVKMVQELCHKVGAWVILVEDHMNACNGFLNDLLLGPSFISNPVDVLKSLCATEHNKNLLRLPQLVPRILFADADCNCLARPAKGFVDRHRVKACRRELIMDGKLPV
jgi:hypothetical protein